MSLKASLMQKLEMLLYENVKTYQVTNIVIVNRVIHFIPLLRLTFSPLRSTSSSIGILDFDSAPCISLLWVTVWAFCVDGVVGLFLCTQGVPNVVCGR